MFADQWRYAPTLESVTASVTSLFLDSSGAPTDVSTAGSLTREPSRGGMDR